MKILSSLVLMLALSIATFAATPLSGRVTDENVAGIENVVVTIQSQLPCADPFWGQATTNVDGDYDLYVNGLCGLTASVYLSGWYFKPASLELIGLGPYADVDFEGFPE